MAQALADSMLLHIAKSVVFAEIERDPGFSGKMLAGMSHRVHRLITDVEAYSLQSGTQRVIGYLLSQYVHETGCDARHVVTLPTSKTVLASRLNVTPEHLSRILHDLTEAGLIAVDGRAVTIIDSRRLKSYQG
jgi:CRP-like cAMP-binding protein